MTIGMIWAQNADRIIGANGAIPWRYPGDFRRFKRVTMGSTIVMGRKTWESIGKPLPGRKSVVVTSRQMSVDPAWDVFAVPHPSDAMFLRPSASGDLWFIGGASIYEAAMPLVDIIDVTYVPDVLLPYELGVVAHGQGDQPPRLRKLVYAPTIDETLFEPGSMLDHEDEPTLKRRVFTRRSTT